MNNEHAGTVSKCISKARAKTTDKGSMGMFIETKDKTLFTL
jgi:hypothetical protein